VSVGSGDVNQMRENIVHMLALYPPRLWSANLLAAVAAVVRVEFPADDVSDAISQVTRRVS